MRKTATLQLMIAVLGEAVLCMSTLCGKLGLCSLRAACFQLPSGCVGMPCCIADAISDCFPLLQEKSVARNMLMMQRTYAYIIYPQIIILSICEAFVREFRALRGLWHSCGCWVWAPARLWVLCAWNAWVCMYECIYFVCSHTYLSRY
jgi:hypothetical protein